MSSTTDDYLTAGSVSPSLSILNDRPKNLARASSSAAKDSLYLRGYGRGFGEKMTYSVGVSYGLGILAGGGYGFLLGLRKGGATPKLAINSILNSCVLKGPALANQAAIITMFYTCFNNITGWARGKDDILNSTIAGALAGGLYRQTPQYVAGAAAVFTGIDYAMRNNYV